MKGMHHGKMPEPKANVQHQGGKVQAPASLPKPKANVQHNHGHSGGMKKGY